MQCEWGRSPREQLVFIGSDLPKLLPDCIFLNKICKNVIITPHPLGWGVIIYHNTMLKLRNLLFLTLRLCSQFTGFDEMEASLGYKSKTSCSLKIKQECVTLWSRSRSQLFWKRPLILQSSAGRHRTWWEGHSKLPLHSNRDINNADTPRDQHRCCQSSGRGEDHFSLFLINAYQSS